MMKLLKEQRELFCLILIVSDYILWFELIKLINEDTASITYTMLATDKVVASALVQQGMIPNAPYAPSYAVSICVLELYQTVQTCYSDPLGSRLRRVDSGAREGSIA